MIIIYKANIVEGIFSNYLYFNIHNYGNQLRDENKNAHKT